ncbi:MAG: GTPase Era [Bacteroidetes bacterium 43-16]|nr:MAG: GTPase Era [Bacteroidetes bacterium 43-16]
MENNHKAGFVNIFGPPNAGKSTLMNALIGENLAIISPKVQTTRHRILGFITEPNYQIIFSDTPGIINPKYKLHNKMMQQVKNAMEDTDVAILMADATESVDGFAEIIGELKVKAPKILIINKIDLIKDPAERKRLVAEYEEKIKVSKVIPVSVTKAINLDQVLPAVLEFLPENPPFFPEDDISDRPTRFFVSELIREKIYYMYDKEIPYHTAVVVQSFKDLPHIVRISADIVVTRETQKMIILGEKGTLIKKLGIKARESIEQFLDKKVYLELFVKVRPKWRESDNHLKEYGY